MNCLPSSSNLCLSTDFVQKFGFFLPLKIPHSAQSFSSTPYLRLCKKCYSVASNSSTSLRRTTNYQPSLWDDSQIQSLNTTSFTGDVHEKRREKLKEDVKRLIKEKSFADQLELFDSLQKLGVAYQFEEEIKYLLNLMKYSEEKLRMEFTEDVHVMALYFRLSREHGFEVSKANCVDTICHHPPLSIGRRSHRQHPRSLKATTICLRPSPLSLPLEV
ncbi:terpene synthase 10-like [Dendrobium catenatum]|uniref:terpene synthase 10-like n=1 Tax=Dendrobium catenatum TaxID=906689 RepID=UPI00109FD4AF|nr:terpene synthase 10-like [Dendrobium catenatum]